MERRLTEKIFAWRAAEQRAKIRFDEPLDRLSISGLRLIASDQIALDHPIDLIAQVVAAAGAGREIEVLENPMRSRAAVNGGDLHIVSETSRQRQVSPAIGRRRLTRC